MFRYAASKRGADAGAPLGAALSLRAGAASWAGALGAGGVGGAGATLTGAEVGCTCWLTSTGGRGVGLTGCARVCGLGGAGLAGSGAAIGKGLGGKMLACMLGAATGGGNSCCACQNTPSASAA